MILYLHGFNSAADPHNEKAVVLSNEFKENFVQISYDSFATRESILKHVCEEAALYNNVVFVGTSLGAYFAIEAGRLLGRPSIGLNVARDPYSFLKRIGSTYALSNYVNGKVSRLTDAAINSYLGKELTKNPEKYCKIPLILLDRNDEVFDSMQTATHFSEFKPHLFSGGNHRFLHILESLDLIKSYVNS